MVCLCMLSSVKNNPSKSAFGFADRYELLVRSHVESLE